MFLIIAKKKSLMRMAIQERVREANPQLGKGLGRAPPGFPVGVGVGPRGVGAEVVGARVVGVGQEW